jgi:Zn-dependent protease
VDGRFADIGRTVALYLITMLLSLTVHEYAHARVADMLGEDTPRKQGRLTLSPLAHYDVWGTFLIPIASILLSGMAFFGWARPVQTNPERYTRKLSMRNGHRLVAVAGPLSNLILAAIAWGGLSILARTQPHLALDSGLVVLLQTLGFVNIGLFVLNMLPLPPLDGSRLLPKQLDGFQRAIAPYSFFILLLVLSAPQLRRVFYWPVGMLGAALQSVLGLSLGPA